MNETLSSEGYEIYNLCAARFSMYGGCIFSPFHLAPVSEQDNNLDIIPHRLLDPTVTGELS